MQQRSEPDDSLDDFPTPPWGGRALCEFLGRTEDLRKLRCWEPAANRGYLVRALRDYFGEVIASDVHDYGTGFAVEDFLFPGKETVADWIITNPPFRLAAEFAIKGLQHGASVALLVRSAFLEGGERHRALFVPHPPSCVLQFVERLPMVKGRVDAKVASATAYSWIVWRQRHPGPSVLHWVPPSRKRLELAGDYDLPAASTAA